MIYTNVSEYSLKPATNKPIMLPTTMNINTTMILDAIFFNLVTMSSIGFSLIQYLKIDERFE